MVPRGRGAQPPSREVAAASIHGRRTLAALFVLAGALTASPPARAAASFNTALVSHVPLSDCSDVSADGDLVFVGRRPGGVTILEVADGRAPRVLTTWAHPTAAMDIVGARPLDGILWLANQSNEAFCLLGLSLANPSAPTIVSQLWRPPLSERVHNLWADGMHLYLSGSGAGGGNYVVNVANPSNPFVEAIVPVGIHDSSIVDDIWYLAGGYTGFHIYDVFVPGNPTFLTSYDASTPDTTFYAHNAWPIGSTGYVACGEEVALPVGGGFVQGSMRIVDFRDFAGPTEVYRWKADGSADPFVTIHNIYNAGDFLYVSYYQEGLKILDVSDPTEPVEVAFYDTYPDVPTELFQGCWGVFPFQGPDRIFLSDRTYGFFRVAFNGARKSTLTGFVRDAETLAPIAGAEIRSLTASRTVKSSGAGAYTLRTGSGSHLVQVVAAGYQSANAVVSLADLGTLQRDFLLSNDVVGLDETEAPTPGLLLGAPRPNPVRDEARLTYSISAGLAGKPLRLEIFDARGRLVRGLLETTAPAGDGTARWDRRDRRGSRVAPGAYEVRLSVGQLRQSVKLLAVE